MCAAPLTAMLKVDQRALRAMEDTRERLAGQGCTERREMLESLVTLVILVLLVTKE